MISSRFVILLAGYGARKILFGKNVSHVYWKEYVIYVRNIIISKEYLLLVRNVSFCTCFDYAQKYIHISQNIVETRKKETRLFFKLHSHLICSDGSA